MVKGRLAAVALLKSFWWIIRTAYPYFVPFGEQSLEASAFVEWIRALAVDALRSWSKDGAAEIVVFAGNYRPNRTDEDGSTNQSETNKRYHGQNVVTNFVALFGWSGQNFVTNFVALFGWSGL